MAFLDSITGLKAIYGFRQGLNSYSSACIQVTNGTTTSDLNCGFTKSQADLLGTDLQILKFYDLTGNGNHTTEVSGIKTILKFDTYNRPYANVVQSQYQSGSGFNLSAPKIFSVYETTPSQYQFLYDFGVGFQFGETTAGGNMRFYNDTASVATFGSYPTGVHQNTAYFQTGADRLFVDGIEKTNTTGGTGDGALSNGKLSLFCYAPGGQVYLTGKFIEFILFDGLISSSDQFNIEQNQKKNLVNPPPPIITTTSPLPDGTIGQSYSKIISTSGTIGTPIFTGNDLPSNLSISTFGLLNGTLGAVGNFIFDITVTDSNSSATKTFSLKVNFQPIVITNNLTLPSAFAKSPYNFQLTSSGGDYGSKQWLDISDDYFNSKISLSSSGVISAPQKAGNFTLRTRVLDQSGNFTDSTLTLSVSSIPLTITSDYQLQTAFIGESYEFNFKATGGSGNLNYNIVTDFYSLPLNFGLTNDGRLYSDEVKEKGTYLFKILIEDENFNMSIKKFSLIIKDRFLEPPIYTLHSRQKARKSKFLD